MPASLKLFGLLMGRMLMAETAVFLKLQLVRRRSLVLRCRVIPSFALPAGQGNNVAHLHSPFNPTSPVIGPLFAHFQDGF